MIEIYFCHKATLFLCKVRIGLNNIFYFCRLNIKFKFIIMKKITLLVALIAILMSCSNEEQPTTVSGRNIEQKSDEPVIEYPQPGDDIEVTEDDEKEYRKFTVKIVCKQPIDGGWVGVGKDSTGQYWTLTHDNSKGITYAKKWDRLFPPMC